MKFLRIAARSIGSFGLQVVQGLVLNIVVTAAMTLIERLLSRRGTEGAKA